MVFITSAQKNNFGMLMKLFFGTAPYQRMAFANDVINKIFGSCTLFSSNCRSWMYEATVTKFEKHRCLRRRFVPHSPNHSSQLRFCVSVFGGLGLRSLKTAPHHLFTISVPVCKFTRRLKIFCHYLLLFVGFSKQIESTSGLILTVIDWSNWFLIAERLTRILNEVNKTGGQDALLVW